MSILESLYVGAALHSSDKHEQCLLVPAISQRVTKSFDNSFESKLLEIRAHDRVNASAPVQVSIPVVLEATFDCNFDFTYNKPPCTLIHQPLVDHIKA